MPEILGRRRRASRLRNAPPGSAAYHQIPGFGAAEGEEFRAPRVRAIAIWFGALGGWRRLSVAFLLGVVAIGAQPPVHAVFMLLPAFIGLIWLLDGATRRIDAFLVGWAFGFGYFVTGIYWIGIAMLTDAARFGWMIPFAVFGLSAYLGAFSGLATLATRLTGVVGISRILVFGAAWTAAEWIRGVILTGFPWNPIGNAWLFSDAMIQFAALTGVFGLSMVTVIAAAMPAVIGEAGRRRWLQSFVALAFLGLLWAGGEARLSMAQVAFVPEVKLRLVQPNINQVHKWREDLREAQFSKLIRLSTPAGRPGQFTHIIWPETATPYFLARERRLRAVLGSIVPEGGLLLTGALRTTDLPEPRFRAWNSLHAIDGRGNIAATYDKFHLVPFGEYVPFRSVLDVAKITTGATDFSSGPGPRTVVLPGLPAVSPLICYEAIFPGEVTENAVRPGWLLNVTNDAWFGQSAGPHQHFASARMRAVEEGLPLVRVANTGISGVIDPYGRVHTRLGLGQEGVIDARLPQALSIPTPFARFGNGILLVLLLVAALAGLLPQHARLLYMG